MNRVSIISAPTSAALQAEINKELVRIEGLTGQIVFRTDVKTDMLNLCYLGTIEWFMSGWQAKTSEQGEAT